MVNRFMMLVIRRVTSLSLWLTTKVFISSASLTSLLIMRPEFDVQVNHFTHQDQHAKDEHVNPLLEHIAKLEDALYNIQFEQHWLEAQTDRQAKYVKSVR
ncbi:hypothetical protein Scep_007281 [Stephania cephalantha]|uniref:GOLD domain-containing protein n=1 Tax=Stephania cephalantha TaxID=152367 RepID=A0AAP0PN31_9MAGN